MKKQRTFYGSMYSEDNAYAWIDHIRKAFDVRRVVVTTSYDKKRWEDKTRVEIFYD